MLKGGLVLITGATRGIGRAIAIELADKGANIAFNYLNGEENAKELKNILEDRGVKVFCKRANVSDFEGVNIFLDEVVENMGNINFLVNNAGITRDRALALMSREEWLEVMDVNLNGLFNITRGVVRNMFRQKAGHIINITSVSGIIGLSAQTNYSASKAGIIGFTKALAKEVAAYNILVNAVAPGFIDTDMLDSLTDDIKEQSKKLIPLKRFGKPEEVSRLVSFLLDGGDSYITGHVFPIDGGLAI